MLGGRDSASCVSSSRGLRGPCPVPTVGDLPGPQAAGTVQATPPLRGSVNAGPHDRSRRSRVIAKGQEGVRLFPAVNHAPVPGALAVAARGCARRDLQVLAEDGLEGLVPVHHGAEHQRLRGKLALSWGGPAGRAWGAGHGEPRGVRGLPLPRGQTSEKWSKRQEMGPSAPPLPPSPGTVLGHPCGPQPPGHKLNGAEVPVARREGVREGEGRGGERGEGRKERRREGAGFTGPLPSWRLAGQWLCTGTGAPACPALTFWVDGVVTAIPMPDPGRTERTLYWKTSRRSPQASPGGRGRAASPNPGPAPWGHGPGFPATGTKTKSVPGSWWALPPTSVCAPCPPHRTHLRPLHVTTHGETG